MYMYMYMSRAHKNGGGGGGGEHVTAHAVVWLNVRLVPINIQSTFHSLTVKVFKCVAITNRGVLVASCWRFGTKSFILNLGTSSPFRQNTCRYSYMLFLIMRS